MVTSNYCLYVKSLTKHCFNIFFEALTAVAVEQVFAGDCQISFFVDTPSTSKDPWPESESEFESEDDFWRLRFAAAPPPGRLKALLKRQVFFVAQFSCVQYSSRIFYAMNNFSGIFNHSGETHCFHAAF